jgi:hypothetical protein
MQRIPGLVVCVLAMLPLTFSRVFAADAPKPADMDQAAAEVKSAYGKAHPEVQEFILHTARTFGRDGMWLNENAYPNLKPEEREERIVYLVKLFNDADYGRHLCMALAEASAFKDPRLVAPLLKVAGYDKPNEDYDCRPKWMAVAALARQESPDAVPLLVSLTDFGKQNVRLWSRAALARMAKDDFKGDKQAWNKWWMSQGHPAIDAKLLKPWTPPPETPKQ